MTNYDVIIIGAGSIGVPVSYSLAENGFKVLVLEKNSSVGEGLNSRAIGGVRATHTTKSKVALCLESIDIFSKWEEKHGDNIGWVKAGYLFPVYSRGIEKRLINEVESIASDGLRARWIDPSGVADLVPGIERNHLIGGVYSPDDGRASPALSIKAFHRYAVTLGVDFKFKESVEGIMQYDNQVTGVFTDKGRYQGDYVVNAAGAFAAKVGAMANVKLPISLEPRQAGLTESTDLIFSPLIVDIRNLNGIQGLYLYQNLRGQITFTMESTGEILSEAGLNQVFKSRIGKLIPDIVNLKISKWWGGVYPMTPDGNPIIGWVDSLKGYVNAVGMGGQGFMLGPGVGKLIYRMISDKLDTDDRTALKDFSDSRSYIKTEFLK